MVPDHQVPGMGYRSIGVDNIDRGGHHITCKHGSHSFANARYRSNSVTSPISRESSITGNAPTFLSSISRAASLMLFSGFVV